eukprot:TRINITY_DN2693_c0_g1_i1.p1 TRINITY_DN2693_c0_g1~~TRINITY_DN2693_c0_g1_i1.p1  ORF type:complete len:103 (-),score=7.52 TRINITY_DN2693_c0_g1_i1:37-345(-)
MNLGTILAFFFYLTTITETSRISATKYSNTAAKKTGAPIPTLSEYLPVLSILAILPTGNANPALADLEVCLGLWDFPLAFPFPPFAIIIFIKSFLIKYSFEL